jgi:hypothetical protein
MMISMEGMVYLPEKTAGVSIKSRLSESREDKGSINAPL